MFNETTCVEAPRGGMVKDVAQIIRYSGPERDCQLQLPTKRFEAFNDGSGCRTEEGLVGFIRFVDGRAEVSRVAAYYQIGKAINFFYTKKYGRNELQRLADLTDIKIGTFQKACRFAQKYSDEHLRALAKGRFIISWRHISQNLKIAPDILIRVYLESASPQEFCNSVTILKNPMGIKSHKDKGQKKKAPAVTALETERDGLLLENAELKKVLATKDLYIEKLESGDMIAKLIAANKNLMKQNDELLDYNESLERQIDQKNTENSKHKRIYAL